MLPDKRNLTHHSIFILLLWWEKKSWNNISSPPHPASSPVASVHRETVQATAMASCASWGRHFLCFNSQLGKASEVTLEKYIHQRKKLWKGRRGSLGVLVCFMFGGFFFPNIFFQISTEMILQVIIMFFYKWEERGGCAMQKAEWAGHNSDLNKCCVIKV